METVPTKQTLIDHFINEGKWHGKWLLVSARNEKSVDKRICRLWDAVVGLDKASVLAAVAEWTKKGKKSSTGLVIDTVSRLRVFKASQEEAYGDGGKYIAFGEKRPELSVHATYLDGAVLPTPTGTRKRMKSSKAAEEQEMDNSAIKEELPVATNCSVSSVEGTNALSTCFDSPPALEKIAVSISNSVWREGRGCENNALPVTETPAALAFVAKQQKMAGEFYSFLESFDLEDHFDSLWDYGVKSTSAVSYLKESDRVKLNLKKFQFAYLQDSARRI
mmetsp:Transcript_59165/g.118756  ORF Transcript_59165/g.118756 Transcript_59165/m.118756 type:complete len:277 (+) Transcript_59165:118-948(+)